MTYKWNVKGFKGEANKVGKELEVIEQTSELTNVSVLEYAKDNKESELNKCFEWNDVIAGEKYRLVQASQILNNISVVISDTQPEEVTKAFVNVRTSEDTKVFKNIVSVLENDEEYIQLKQKAERDFISYKEKYNKILKLKDLKDIITRNI
jgi:hypothetical protein